MTVSEKKSEQSITKLIKTKLNTIETNKQLKCLLYRQEMLVNMKF